MNHAKSDALMFSHYKLVSLLLHFTIIYIAHGFIFSNNFTCCSVRTGFIITHAYIFRRGEEKIAFFRFKLSSSRLTHSISDGVASIEVFSTKRITKPFTINAYDFQRNNNCSFIRKSVWKMQ